MSFFGKLEDKLINFLTCICWWFDLRFNLKSKDLANPFMVLVGFLIFLIDNSIFVDIYLFIFAAFLAIILNIFLGKHIYEKSKSPPNPNKFNNLFKLSTVLSCLFTFYYTKDILSPIFTVMLFSWFYILCTEPMPPAEREKRLNKNKLSKLATANQM